MTSQDQARVLLGKARDDAVAVRKFAEDSEIADAVVGFHAQQAIEKALKAALSAHDRAYPLRGDIDDQLDRVRTVGIVEAVMRWAEPQVKPPGQRD